MTTLSEPLHAFAREFHVILARGYLRKWVPLSIVIGLAAGASSIAFMAALQAATAFFLHEIVGYIPPMPAGEGGEAFIMPTRPYLIPIVTTLGGLLSGLLVYIFAPEAEGHGTDTAIDAFHNKNGEIRARVPPLKVAASAITIGSGGSAGREGPIALTSAGVASILGKLLKMPVRDRRIALAAGIGAGIGSIFKAPFGGAILSAEILYLNDFEIQALVPAFLSSVIAYSLFASVYGWQPIFSGVSGYGFHDPLSLIIYGFIGILCGLIGILYVKSFYGFKELFDRIPIPKVLKPAVGGLALGIIGIFFPHVLGTGYGWIQKAMNGDFTAIPITVVFALIFLKILATSLTVGSGGSGGVFAPSLVIGGMTGAATWIIFNHLGLTGGVGPAPYMIVSMMAFFGGVGKAPIAVILMVSEMTGTYSLLVPSMLSTVLAYAITGRYTIYISQVPTRADSPAHLSEYAIPLLQKIKVRDAMTRNVISASPKTPIMKVAKMMAEREIKGIPVIDDDGRLVGMVTFSDILKIPPENRADIKVEDIMCRQVVVAYPEESLYDAFEKMAHYQIGRLPVLKSPRDRELVGIITRGDIGRVYELKLRHMLELKEESTQG